MDFTITSSAACESPAVVWANYHQFSPGDSVSNRFVLSRALIWGVAGRGSVTCAGEVVTLIPSTWVLLPWRHDVLYRADPRDPFMVGAVHLIPSHDATVPVQLRAAHGRRDPLGNLSHRQDADWPDLRGVVKGSASAGHQLLMLAALAVDVVQSDGADSSQLRAMGVLLLSALRRTLRRAQTDDLPPQLTRMRQFLVDHFDRELTVADVAAAGGVSAPTAQRLFRLHTGSTVGLFLRDQRIRTAQDLLRTTNASVESVGRSVGFDDPSYFSRAFKKASGLSPRAFAKHARLI